MEIRSTWLSVPKFAEECQVDSALIYAAIHQGTLKVRKDQTGKIEINLETQKGIFLQNRQTLNKKITENRKIAKENPNGTDKSMPEGFIQDAPGDSGYVPLANPLYKLKDFDTDDEVSSSGLNYIQSRAKKENALARKAQIDALVAEGRLIEKDLVVRKWKEIAVNVRKSIIAIPDRLSPLLVGQMDHFKIREIMLTEINFALKNLAFEIRDGKVISNAQEE
jgi:hypothetical protein